MSELSSNCCEIRTQKDIHWRTWTFSNTSFDSRYHLVVDIKLWAMFELNTMPKRLFNECINCVDVLVFCVFSIMGLMSESGLSIS